MTYTLCSYKSDNLHGHRERYILLEVGLSGLNDTNYDTK